MMIQVVSRRTELVGKTNSIVNVRRDELDNADEAKRWLLVLPIPASGCEINARAFVLRLRYHFGLRLCADGEECPRCGSPLDPFGEHLINCNHGLSPRYSRKIHQHNLICFIVTSLFKSANRAPEREVTVERFLQRLYASTKQPQPEIIRSLLDMQPDIIALGANGVYDILDVSIHSSPELMRGGLQWKLRKYTPLLRCFPEVAELILAGDNADLDPIPSSPMSTAKMAEWDAKVLGLNGSLKEAADTNASLIPTYGPDRLLKTRMARRSDFCSLLASSLRCNCRHRR